ncbi:MAG: hypothetical protein GF418_04310, partial [Chitinivibrionales bacterium]|nr:hypothetical protein [Chitinivibrionales bacterium]MBD3394831.1 hypothetical protein [Chitinivibrionales bacterium]
MKRRVVVTGLGAICSAGRSVQELGDAVAAGRQCFSRIPDPRLQHLRAACAGLISDFVAEEHVHDPQIRELDRFVHYAIAAASQALSHAGLTPRDLNADMGLVFATCSGPMQTIESHYARIIQGKPSLSANKLFAKKYYSGAHALCRTFGIKGPSVTVTTACSASAGAIGIASDMIRCGMVKAALVGGSDTFSSTTIAGFDGLKATAEGMCAPFSKPVGLNLGEGSGFVVLEDASHARARGATVVAEILGYGLSNDAHHCSAPDASGRGQALAMERALAQAGLSREDIPYVNAHGTGTAANDKAETKAIARIFREKAGSLAVSSTKSMIGHCLGAAGCLEILAAIACAERGVYPPTANFRGAREGCSLDYVPDMGRAWQGRPVFMSNNFAFGGNNASVVVRAGSERGAAVEDAADQPDTAVCITACGTVTAAGLGPDALIAAARRGESLAGEKRWGPVTAPAGIVPPIDERSVDRRLDVRGMDRPSRLATLAARCTLTAASYPDRPKDLARVGFYLCIAGPPSGPEEEHITSLLQEDFRISQVQAFPYVVPNSIAGNVSRALSLTGHNTVLCGGKGIGLLGIALAAKAIEAGHVECCMAGAVDELSERIMADEISAGADVNGSAPRGEAATWLMLENAAHAKARHAEVLATIRGSAFASAAGESASWEEHFSRTVKRAITTAGIAPADIGA